MQPSSLVYAAGLRGVDEKRNDAKTPLCIISFLRLIGFNDPIFRRILTIEELVQDTIFSISLLLAVVALEDVNTLEIHV